MTDQIKSVLLTVGRLPVSLELARLFHANGWRVLVADPMGWNVSRLSNRVHRCFVVPSPVQDSSAWGDRIIEIIDQESISLVVPVSEETLFVAELKDRLESKAVVLSMSHDLLLSLHDKWCFSMKAMQLGLAVPETARCDEAAAVSLMNREATVQKPRFGCSGVGVSWHAQGSTLVVEHQRASHIVQQCIDGAACCSFAIAVQGQVQLCVVYRPQMEAGSVAVCLEAVQAPEEVIQVVEAIVADTAFTGMIAFDHLWSEQHGWQVIECNPRATSGLHLLPSSAVYSALMKGMNHLSRQDILPPTLTDEVGIDDARHDVRDSHEVPVATPLTRDEPRVPSRVDVRGKLIPTGPRVQEFWSHLAELQGRLLRARFESVHWKRLFVTRHICWSQHDLKPTLLFVPVNLVLLLRAWRAGMAIPQIVMQDLGWRPSVDQPLPDDERSP